VKTAIAICLIVNLSAVIIIACGFKEPTIDIVLCTCSAGISGYNLRSLLSELLDDEKDCDA
jgi:hypothetical protein